MGVEPSSVYSTPLALFWWMLLVQVVDLNVGELQMYGTVNWLNASDDLGKMKKGTELLTLLFIFKTGVVLMAQERVKGKRKPRVRSALHKA